MISFTLDEALGSAVGHTSLEILATNHFVPVTVAGPHGRPSIFIDCMDSDLPANGLMIAASWKTHEPDAIPCPFVARVMGPRKDQLELLRPNPHWQFVKGGNGELRSFLDSCYIVHPDELGYFDCFLSPKFCSVEHLALLLREVGGVIDETERLLDEMRQDPVEPLADTAHLFKLFILQTISIREERDEAKKLARESDRRLREIAGRAETILLRNQIMPLQGLVKHADSMVRTGASQVASMISAIRGVTGLKCMTSEQRFIDTEEWWPQVAQEEDLIQRYLSEVV